MAGKIAKFSPIDPQEDPYGYLGFTRNSDDGSIKRTNVALPKTTVSSCDNNPDLQVKDAVINQDKNTWARVFLPKKSIQSQPNSKFPLLIFFHGGGFVVCSAATPFFDSFYTTLVTDLQVVIVSVEYRLAPEHKLPAAYDDSEEAIQWITSSKDEWLAEYADLSNSFLMGSSAGANIAYHVGLRAGSRSSGDLEALKIKGLILHQPFFGGMKRTESELKGMDDKVLPPCITDIMWELALPEGVDRDHEFCHPVKSFKPGQFDKIKDLGWKILVTGYQGDPLYDRQMEFVKTLEERDLAIVAKFQEGGFHGADTFDLPRLKTLSQGVKEFMESVFCN
ncbi:OLC1v1031314C1 [Oldenlandia corymbosa var. corymbosa]|uniref:OLC1v1031314C1 n=1 Tax=Oldenlandia corymbosa var. corymbosa TaxID=529605 RepID=A0AAV1CIZ2_OLDCO|nr:OLC1v1031314C1 [Oldenlandia corymbosa var. corymbosa]